MTTRILSVRELNRATLSRQALLRREAAPAAQMLERLAGMQAQQAIGPYVGLWTRLEHFERDELARLIDAHQVVKATLMRGTLHLVTADDYLRFRGALQPMLDEAQRDIAGRNGRDLDIAAVAEAGRKFFAGGAYSFAELTTHLTALYPDDDPGALRYTVRSMVPLVQVPNDSRWSYPGNAKFTLAETWIGRPIPPHDDVPALIRRYLAAFGPASAADFRAWSYLSNVAPAFDALRDELVVYRGETKVELFDLPGIDLPDADAPAPARFLPEFDNLLLSHAKRTRVFADEHRKAIWVSGNLRVLPTFLVDGFAAGTWTVGVKRGEAAITAKPFATLANADRAALEEEGERLVRWIEPDAKHYALRFES